MALPQPPQDIPAPIPEPDNVVLPPAPGAEPLTPPAAADAIEEVHENDVLKRRAKFSWKKFGGDGFMVSVAVHVLLAILGIFWFVTKYTAAPKKPDSEVFATGAGGGAQGDKTKAFEHKLKTRNTQVKLPSRIVSRSANAAVSLPSTPSGSTAAFAMGLASGGMSKGAGGGSGGGEGTGIGIGKGGGRNFVSAFGSKGFGAGGLPGTFYDLKQLADGKPSGIGSEGPYFAFIRTFIKRWDGDLLKKYFKSDVPVMAERMFIPAMPSAKAPEAFEVADKVKPSFWIAVYQGKVIAPVSGKIRLWGVGDQMLIVNFNGKNVLDSGYFLATEPEPGNGRGYTKPVLGSGATIGKGVHFEAAKVPIRGSTWIEVTKGREYPLKMIIGDTGGECSFHLMWEQEPKDKVAQGAGAALRIFHLASSPVPDEQLANFVHPRSHKTYTYGGINLDAQVDSPVWTAKREAAKINR